MTECKTFDWDELEFCTRKERIEKLKRHVQEITGDDGLIYENPEAPPEILEQFWRGVVEYEEKHLGLAPDASLPPLDFPDATGMTEEELHDLLWQRIFELAERRIFIEQTDHLSERELYEVLSSMEMRELTTEVVPENGAIHFDILGGYGEEDIELYLKYYADEATRADWKKQWPEDPIPESVAPPFDRDSKLPKPRYEAPGDLKEC